MPTNTENKTAEKGFFAKVLDFLTATFRWFASLFSKKDTIEPSTKAQVPAKEPVKADSLNEEERKAQEEDDKKLQDEIDECVNGMFEEDVKSLKPLMFR